MNPILGNLIVGGVLLVVVALSVRSIWKKRKTGGCSCNCGECGGCGSVRKH